MPKLVSILAAAAGLSLLAAASLPVAQFAAGLAIMAFAGAACGRLVGAEGLASWCFGAFTVCAMAAIGLPMAGGFVRALIGDPAVRGLLCVFTALAFLAGLAWVALRVALAHPPEARIARRPRREWERLPEPEPPLRDWRATPPGRDDDDLDLLGGRRGR